MGKRVRGRRAGTFRLAAELVSMGEHLHPQDGERGYGAVDGP